MTSRHEMNWIRVLPSVARVFSTCSVRQYAAVVIDPENRVLALGYNGSPTGMAHCTDGGCPRANQPVVTPGQDYSSCTAQHAEAGALLWADPARRRGSTIVVSGPPCLECARLIASSGIKRCVFPWKEGYPDIGKVIDFMYEAGIEVDIPLVEDAVSRWGGEATVVEALEDGRLRIVDPGSEIQMVERAVLEKFVEHVNRLVDTVEVLNAVVKKHTA